MTSPSSSQRSQSAFVHSDHPVTSTLHHDAQYHGLHPDQYRQSPTADLFYDLYIAALVDSDWPEEPRGLDTSLFLPEPCTANELFYLPPRIQKYWIKSLYKELKGLIVDEEAFDKNVTAPPGVQVLPVKDVYKCKIQSDGTIDKLKVRIAIRGDLDKDAIGENNWAPAITFIILKLFLAEAARLGLRIYQIDFISAYLQALMDRPVYVRFPAKWAKPTRSRQAYHKGVHCL